MTASCAYKRLLANVRTVAHCGNINTCLESCVMNCRWGQWMGGLGTGNALINRGQLLNSWKQLDRKTNGWCLIFFYSSIFFLPLISKGHFHFLKKETKKPQTDLHNLASAAIRGLAQAEETRPCLFFKALHSELCAHKHTHTYILCARAPIQKKFCFECSGLQNTLNNSSWWKGKKINFLCINNDGLRTERVHYGHSAVHTLIHLCAIQQKKPQKNTDLVAVCMFSSLFKKSGLI